jgi:uncharacterized protein (TIGR02449 family)
VLACSQRSVPSVADNLIQALEKKVNDLIELSRDLNRENRALKLRTAELQKERRELLERQRRASEHVENSLARLRSLDGSA